MRWVSRLLVALAALQLGDLASTLVGLRMGASEGNPAAAAALGLGVEVFVAAKVALAGLTLAFVPMVEESRQRLVGMGSMCAAMVLLFAGVLLANMVTTMQLA